ncbi:helix-turn-helix transcriptional regulator [Dactylosporangium sp. NPDC049525]|uniref:helix-turn-helix transcriptional regulator n=1 Tax=Dactylosporangium sp. NPDC049525 TaxID=3154730 RepID=UPI003416F5E1
MRTARLGSGAAATRAAIEALCAQPLEPEVIVQEVAERIGRVVPHDTAAWMRTDPETLLPTHALTLGLPDADSVAAAKARGEFVDHDFNRFLDLDRSGRTVATLTAATGGDLTRSDRHQAVYAPRGLHDELRLLARSATSTWALACLVRAADAPPFSAEETRYLAGIARHVGDGLRAALIRTARPAHTAETARTADPGAGPGMLVLDEQGRIEAATAEATRWLDRLPRSGPGETPLPVAMVALQAQSGHTGRPARVRVRLADGGWLLVHADILVAGASGPPRVAVMLELAAPAELLPVLFALHGLTDRERQVTGLLLAGHGTDDVARQLHVSRHTVRDHIKATFGKVGVSSRAELTATLAGA